MRLSHASERGRQQLALLALVTRRLASSRRGRLARDPHCAVGEGGCRRPYVATAGRDGGGAAVLPPPPPPPRRKRNAAAQESPPAEPAPPAGRRARRGGTAVEALAVVGVEIIEEAARQATLSRRGERRHTPSSPEASPADGDASDSDLGADAVLVSASTAAAAAADTAAAAARPVAMTRRRATFLASRRARCWRRRRAEARCLLPRGGSAACSSAQESLGGSHAEGSRGLG